MEYIYHSPSLPLLLVMEEAVLAKSKIYHKKLHLYYLFLVQTYFCRSFPPINRATATRAQKYSLFFSSIFSYFIMKHSVGPNGVKLLSSSSPHEADSPGCSDCKYTSHCESGPGLLLQAQMYQVLLVISVPIGHGMSPVVRIPTRCCPQSCPAPVYVCSWQTEYQKFLCGRNHALIIWFFPNIPLFHHEAFCWSQRS